MYYRKLREVWESVRAGAYTHSHPSYSSEVGSLAMSIPSVEVGAGKLITMRYVEDMGSPHSTLSSPHAQESKTHSSQTERGRERERV